MPTISPASIPTKAPGSLFSSLTGGDPTLNIRWLTALDPVFFEVLNRPLADITVRQLVIAKALDVINTQLGHQALFPFIIQPTLNVDTHITEFPIGLIWDIHVSMPIKWQDIRLARVERLIGGTNGDTANEFTGTLRLIFSGNLANGSERYMFYADYVIDSPLAFQRVAISPATSAIAHATNVISQSDGTTVGGYIIFKTLNLLDPNVQALFVDLAPPDNISNPAVYEITNTVSGGTNVTEDFDFNSMVHGTGLLTDSAYNAIPPLNTDVQTWITAFNYPFDSDALLKSTDNDIYGNYFAIPPGLFKEFNITAPASDNVSTESNSYTVYISKIQQIQTGYLRIFFACRTPTLQAVLSVIEEFAYLDLRTSGQPNDLIPIIPLTTSANVTPNTERQMGVGYVILSNLWDGTASSIASFFSAFDGIPYDDKIAHYSMSSTRVSSFGVSRISRYSPSFGQASALTGSTSNRAVPIEPSDQNKYVTERDRGLGDRIDLDARFVSVAAIERYGYSGGNTHRIVKLVVDSTLVPQDSSYYDNVIKPRLNYLLGGRDPEFGDGWYNGTRFLWFNGDTWQG